MSAATALARGRVRAEESMVDTCTIRRVTGSTTDPASGVITPTWSPIYTGKCKVQQQSASASATDVGEAQVLLSRLELHLPISATGILDEDEATITAAVHDPELTGRVFLVKGVPHKTYATARRVGLTERTS